MKKSAVKQRYRYETPEGGWGYLVCLGMILIFAAAGSGITCFGLIFNDFLKSIGQATTAVAIISSSSFGAMSFAGLFSNTFIKRFGMRNVGLFGGFFYFLGSVVQIFAQQVVHLFLASAIHGVAFGLIIPVIFSTFNHYFVKRRVLMMSTAQAIIGLGHMGYPILVRILLDLYGFRGCLAVLTAINSHAIFGMLVMHPVEWHMKKVPISEEEWQVEQSVKDDSDDDEKSHEVQLKPLMPELKETLHRKSGDILQYTKSIDTLKHLKMTESANASRRASSIASLGNWTSAVVVSEALEPTSSKEIGKWQFVVNFLDLTLLKKPIYINIVLGISFAFYADIAFFTIQPLYLFELKYTKAQIANIIAIGAGADLVSRCALAISSIFCTIPSRYVYLAGAVFSLIARYAFLYAYDFWSMACLTALIGFLKTWLHVPLPLVFAEYLPKERFSSGYGLFMFLQGNIMFAIGPIMGYVRDTTKSYEMTFHFLNIFLMACVVPWTIEIILVQCRKKKTSNQFERNPNERKTSI